MISRADKYTILTTSGFVLLAALFFCLRLGTIARWAAPYAMPLPVLFLAICMSFYCRRADWIPAALLFSAFGDMAGSADSFLWQISFFAVAHICYIAFFIRNFRFRKMVLPLLLAALCAAIALSCVIVPKTEGVLRRFVTSYILIITAMVAAAVFNRSRGYLFYVIAALIFMASDSVIAWNRFVQRIPDAAAYIMSTYYTAQLMFAVTTIRTRAR